MKKFHLELGNPVVVKQGEVGDTAWGNYQFPAFYRTEKGGIYLHWEYGKDSIDYQSVFQCAISDDEGKTWRARTPEDTLAYPLMKNGKRFAGFERRGAHPAEYTKKYTPVAEARGKKYFFADDIEETEDTTVWAEEYDPATGKTERFACRINWPNKPLYMNGDRVFPVTTMFYICTFTGYVTVDGDLYYATYANGLDSDASRENAVQKTVGFPGVYLFRSTDCGRTWDYLSQILPPEEAVAAPRADGFCEPMMARVPDGSFVMLIRTGSNHPSYITRSTDNCKTWSKPVIFDGIGVLPQILPLKCGVTLSSYGRPILKLRATGDPAAMAWEEPIVVDDLYAMDQEDFLKRSCFYTRLLPLDDHTALLAYTDFRYPNADGEPVKTVLVRTVTVVED